MGGGKKKGRFFEYKKWGGGRIACGGASEKQRDRTQVENCNMTEEQPKKGKEIVRLPKAQSLKKRTVRLESPVKKGEKKGKMIRFLH